MTKITIKRGTTLAILATCKSSGTPVVLDNTYQVAAAIALASSEGDGLDLSPIITNAGKISISYDTVDLFPGKYKIDIRITNPAGTEEWTEDMSVVVTEPVTKPSTRA